jgi:MYXO-CTERM domain-containing protein
MMPAASLSPNTSPRPAGVGRGRNQRDLVDHAQPERKPGGDGELLYTDTEIGAADENGLRPFRWNGSDWEEFGDNVEIDFVHHCVTVQGVSEFSPWTLFDTSGTPQEPTAARVVGLSARSFAPLAALLVLGGAAALRRRRP